MTVRRLASVAAAAVVAFQLAVLPAACASAQVGQGSAMPAARRVAVDTVSLRRTLDSLADAHHGTVGYAVFDIDGGTRLSRCGDETFPTASLIKVATNLLLDRVIIRRCGTRWSRSGCR
jgi:beta-lactamase class A